MEQPVKTNTFQGFEEFLVNNGFVKPQVLEQLKAYEKQSGQTFNQLLLSQKVLEEEDLAKAKAAFFNIPYVDLRQTPVSPTVLALIPKESMNFYNLAPFEFAPPVLKVAVTDPGNLLALEALEFLGQKQNLQVQLYLATETSVETAVGKRMNLKKVVGEALQDIKSKEQGGLKPEAEQKKEAQPRVIEEAPIVKIVDVI